MICKKCGCHNNEDCSTCWFCDAILIAKGLVFLLIMMICPLSAHAYTDTQAIKSIIGEAEGESFSGKLAVAEAIRHRGNLHGVYGLHAKRVIHVLYSAKTYAECKKAWLESLHTNTTHGATGWGNASDLVLFHKDAWFNRAVITAHIGNQWFYKIGGK